MTRPLGERGFTLVEVLVALAIVAVALAAGLRALHLSAHGTQRLHDRSLALQAAHNHLAELRLRRAFPVPGVSMEPCPQGLLPLVCEQQVKASMNANFRQVTVVARLPNGPALAELSGVLSVLP